jgi:hypothetical protein
MYMERNWKNATKTTNANARMLGYDDLPDDFHTAAAVFGGGLIMIGGVAFCIEKVCGGPPPPRVHAVPVGTPDGALPMSTATVEIQN